MFPEFKPRLSGYRFAGGAKLTDFVSDVVFYHPLVKMDVIKAMENLSLPEHRIYPMRIYYRKSPRLYFLPFFVRTRIKDYIIWEKSKFYDTKLAFKSADLDSIYDKRLNDLTFTSYEDYINNKTSGTEVESLALKVGCNNDYDYMRMDIFRYKLISQRFIDIVERLGLTGLEWGRPIRIQVYE